MDKQRVLVVEDEWLVAADLERVLRRAGYEVIGPAPNIGTALQLIDNGAISAALLDISLGQEKSFPIAEKLNLEGVPFAFLTGFSEREIPTGLRHAPLIGKPAPAAKVLDIIALLLSGGAGVA